LLVTTGLPRGNGQIERINQTLIHLLTKLSSPKSDEWFKFVDVAQKYLNATPSRSIGKTLFQLMFGTNIRLRDNVQVREGEWAQIFNEKCDHLRTEVKEKIAKIQDENRKTFNKKRKESMKYADDDLIAIKRTQTGPSLKFRPKFLEPYQVVRTMGNDRYVVKRVREESHEMRICGNAELAERL